MTSIMREDIISNIRNLASDYVSKCKEALGSSADVYVSRIPTSNADYLDTDVPRSSTIAMPWTVSPTSCFTRMALIP